MTLSPLQPFQPQPPDSATIRQKKCAIRQTGKTQPTSSQDSVQFSGKSRTQQTPKFAGDVTLGDRLKGSGRAVLQDVTSLKWWGKQTAISTAITLATCWLPGSQLVTIPLWLGLTLAHSAVDGLWNPKSYDPEAKKLEEQLKKQKAAQPEQDWSSSKRATGAAKGLWKGIKSGFTDDFGKKLLWSGALCLATCWLPGSQLVLVPALFCTYAACDGTMNAYRGWKDPSRYNVKPE